MTREQFENIYNWSDLFEACNEIGYDAPCDGIYDSYAYDDWANEQLVDWARDYSWQDLLSKLQDIESNSGYDTYIWDDYYCIYRPTDDDDFVSAKDCLEDYMNHNDLWETEEEEPEAEEEEPVSWEPEEDPEDVEPIPDEDFSLGEMFAAGIGCIRVINEEALEAARQQDRAFAEMNSLVF